MPVANQAQRWLRCCYGYEQFRPGQQPIIDAIVSGQDVFAVMPTGGGKSLCFQIPALMLPGLTIVISPLIALMKDQVETLCARGISATYVNSSLPAHEVAVRLRQTARGRYKLLYVAPERLRSPRFATLVSGLRVGLIAVDEAHCVSQWGHDFRPSYAAIAPFVASLHRRPVVAAFTATATAAVRSDVVALLGLHHPYLLTTGFDRPNLLLMVRRHANKDDYLTRYLARHADDSGIIYTGTRNQTDHVYDILHQTGVAVSKYHAGMDSEQRYTMQTDFLTGKSQVMVATNAFGMGIDKGNIRYVMHYCMPKTVEAYYQEAGRAGRDGQPAQCVLLYDDADIVLQRWLIDHSCSDQNRKKLERAKLNAMIRYCQTNRCLREYILRYFGEATAGRCDRCGNCLQPGLWAMVSGYWQSAKNVVARIWPHSR